MQSTDDNETNGDARPPAVGVAAWWLVYLGIYLVLVTGVTWREAVAGAVVSALAVGVSIVALRSADIGFAGDVPKLWRLGAVARIIVSEASAYAGALLRLLRGRQPDSRYVAVPLGERFEASTDAAVTLEAAIAPNTLLIAVLEGQDAVLLHQLSASPRAKTSFPRWSP